jgi:hypothetical protein
VERLENAVMNTYRADPVIRLLTVIVSVFYRVASVFGVLLIVAVSTLELFAENETLQKFSIGVPTKVELESRPIGTAWGGSLTLRMDEAEGSVRVPIASAPAGFRLVAYLGLAVIYVLFLRFVFHLRELFRRVRAGAPFDERNAPTLRWLGMLLILIDVLGSTYRFGLSQLVLRAMSPPSVPLTSSFSMDGTTIFIGLVLLALAEIFRRGAVLEDEQAHVV